MKTLYLVRHGTVHNPDRITYRRLPGFHLGERGRREAGLAEEQLRSVQADVMIHSPMERAEETASILNLTKLIPTRTEEGINEWDAEETFEEVRSRMRAFFEDWVHGPEQIAIAVSHRDPIRALLHGLADTDFVWTDDREPPFALPPCGVYKIEGHIGNMTTSLIWMPEELK